VRVADPLRSVVLRQHFWARVLGGSRISAGTRNDAEMGGAVAHLDAVRLS
jgi:hypothetical protein